jgi:hypothetical protein
MTPRLCRIVLAGGVCGVLAAGAGIAWAPVREWLLPVAPPPEVRAPETRLPIGAGVAPPALPEVGVERLRPVPPALVPPARRPLPFAAGEEARYRIIWQGGPGLSLPAGEAVFTVQAIPGSRGDAPAGLRLELQIQTSGLVSAFFEARDRFWSVVGPDLLPTLHVQELHEGRRQATRAATFDARNRRVVAAEGPPESVRDGVEFPLAPGARDPLSAFFHARVVELQPGVAVRVPVNNVGHPLVVVLRSLGSGHLTLDGRLQQAERVDARVEDPAATGEQPSAVAWLSMDSRRLPLAIDIAAPFGSFRAELTAYRAGAAPEAR